LNWGSALETTAFYESLDRICFTHSKIILFFTHHTRPSIKVKRLNYPPFYQISIQLSPTYLFLMNLFISFTDSNVIT
uniref:Uncharacterized protein n=1 Tax=Oryza brachyantha TaxID=4533 RepID=J3LYB0_ORYBR